MGDAAFTEQASVLMLGAISPDSKSALNEQERTEKTREASCHLRQTASKHLPDQDTGVPERHEGRRRAVNTNPHHVTHLTKPAAVTLCGHRERQERWQRHRLVPFL